MARTETTNVGDVFGKLTVTKIYRQLRKNNTSYKYLAECKCECGNTWSVEKGNLKRKTNPTRQCGFCNSREEYAKANGNSIKKDSNEIEHKSYYTWKAIKARCYNKNNKRYSRYGGRGIEVCFRWLEGYDNFLSDIGLPPTKSHSIDRIDNDGNYEPDNCRWVGLHEQANNKSTNRVITAFGKTMNLNQWSNDVGIKRETIARRLNNGYKPEDALKNEKASKYIYINPKGEFKSLKEAGEAFGLQTSATHSRFKSDNFPEWKKVMI